MVEAQDAVQVVDLVYHQPGDAPFEYGDAAITVVSWCSTWTVSGRGTRQRTSKKLRHPSYCSSVPIYSTFHQLYDQIGQPFLIDAAYTMSVDPAAGWRGQRCLAGGGCIIDMGYHVIDMLLWYFGLPDRVLAQYSATARPELDYDAEDTAYILFGFDSGLVGTVLLSRWIPPKTEQIRVVGTRGAIVLERGRIQRLRSDGELVESLSREESWPAAATAQVDHFCRVLHGSRCNVSGPGSHLAHAAFIDAAYASSRAGGFVNPKELLT